MKPSYTSAQTACLLALIQCYQRDGRATIGGVARQMGKAKSTVQVHLKRLERAGLVASELDSCGTLRPLVEVVG